MYIDNEIIDRVAITLFPHIADKKKKEIIHQIVEVSILFYVQEYNKKFQQALEEVCNHVIEDQPNGN